MKAHISTITDSTSARPSVLHLKTWQPDKLVWNSFFKNYVKGPCSSTRLGPIVRPLVTMVFLKREINVDWSHFWRRHQRKRIGAGQQVTFLLPKHLSRNIWKFAFLEIEMHRRCMLKAFVENDLEIYRQVSFWVYWCIRNFYSLFLPVLLLFIFQWKRNESYIDSGTLNSCVPNLVSIR